MTLSELIQQLDAAEVKIKRVGDRLELQPSSENIRPDLLAGIENFKDSLIELFDPHDSIYTGPIPLVGERDFYELSPAQRRLWVSHQVEEVQNAYNVFDTIVIDSEVNVIALQAAFEMLLQRHAILRTNFILINGEPGQKINHSLYSKLSYIDLRGRPDRYASIRAMADHETKRIFDLAGGQLIIASLFQLEDEKYVFLINMHHIICDEHSLRVIKNELFMLYQACRDGSPDELPDLRIQYYDYAHWHNNLMDSDVIMAYRNYWLDIFKDKTPVLNLSVDQAWPTSKTYNGRAYEVQLTAYEISGIRHIGEENGSSAFIVFVALVNAFLYKYTGQYDIVLGTLTEGRYNEDLAGQIGFYVNTVPLRTIFHPDDTFRQLLQKSRETILSAFDNQIYPFDAIVDDLRIQRDLSRNPLFDVLVSYMEGQEDDRDIQPDKFMMRSLHSKFALSFALINNKGNLKLHIGFNSDIFLDDTIQRMLRNFQTLLDAVIKEEIPLKQLPFLSPEERTCLLEVFIGPPTPFADENTLAQLFEMQVAKAPDAVALITKAGRLTYGQLNRSANQLARLLEAAYEVRRGDLVGVMMAPSFDLITTLLAILKLGATYVPILAEYPNERILYMLQDTGLRVLATDNPSRTEALGLADPGLAIAMVTDGGYAELSGDNLNTIFSSTDLACIMYTSGSTGHPKGVMLEHKGLVNRIQWLWTNRGFSATDVYFQKTTYAFDVSIGEIFMTLCYGARLFLPASDFSATSGEIADYIRDFDITVIHFSPSALNLFLEDLPVQEFESLKNLRLVIASGEALMPHTVRNYYNRIAAPLLNMYGPTEASIEVSIYETRKEDKIVPIGKPISNVRLYILDENSELLPIGVIGEVCIGGIAVARGYFRKQSQTNEKFVADPYGNSGDRIYRTGDIGRWLPDGNIEFLGRRDNQTSIGGYRIELGEIETALCGHPEVSNAAVIEWRDASGDASLAAYIEMNIPVPGNDDTDEEGASAIITPEEVLLLENINATDRVYEKIFTFKELFEEQVRKTSEETAMICGQDRLSYRLLNETANRMAAFLNAGYGLTAGMIVGVFVKRSIESVITIFSLVKAGCIYVPIDDEYPWGRVSYIMRDCRMQLLITDREDLNNSDAAPCKIIQLKEIAAELNRYSPENPTGIISSQDPLYIIYTSGSTGEPKGVLVENASLFNVSQAWREAYGLRNFKVSLLQIASIAFDVFTGDLCRALLNGGKMVIAARDLVTDPQYIYSLLYEHQVNILESTPSLLLPLLDYIHNNQLDISFLKILIFGSEMLLMEEFKKTVERFGEKVRIINSYGTTETTIDSSFFEAVNGQFPDCANTPIGRPLINTRFYILNESLEKVPVGVTGNLYISGGGVSRGYVNNKILTDAAFIPNPFEKKSRLYKTGDLARWLPDGNAELTGRSDNQIKLRGYRIETGEIENTIIKYPGIEKSILVMKQDDEGSLCMVAYYTARQTIAISTLRSFLEKSMPLYMIPSVFIRLQAFPITKNGKIDRKLLPDPVFSGNYKQLKWRNYLLGKLPKYMVPSTYIQLDKLPKTVSGKIDRRALPDAGDLVIASDRAYLPPGSPVEAALVNIWEEVLLRQKIGVDDDFFDLGGHSLKAVRIFSLMHKRMSIRKETNLSLKDLYNYPTVRQLAEVIQQGIREHSLLITLNKYTPLKKNIYMIPPVLGSSTVFKSLAENLEGSVNCLGLMSKGFDNADSFDESIEQMADVFIKEVLLHKNKGKLYLLGYSMGCLVTFEMAKKLEKQGFDLGILLIDSPVADNERALITDKALIEKEFDRELQHSFHGLAQSMEHLKNVFLNNIQIAGNYKMTGFLESGILAVEAVDAGKISCMKKWETYTRKSFCHLTLDDSHFGIIYNKALPDIVDSYVNS